MQKAEEDKANYFKMDRTAFDYIDEGYEKRLIEQQLGMTDEQRFYAMEIIRMGSITNHEYKMDKMHFQIRKGIDEI